MRTLCVLPMLAMMATTAFAQTPKTPPVVIETRLDMGTPSLKITREGGNLRAKVVMEPSLISSNNVVHRVPDLILSARVGVWAQTKETPEYHYSVDSTPIAVTIMKVDKVEQDFVFSEDELWVKDKPICLQLQGITRLDGSPISTVDVVCEPSKT